MSRRDQVREEELTTLALHSIRVCWPTYRTFRTFCHRNSFPVSLRSIAPWVAQMDGTLGVRTIRLYVKRVRRYLKYLASPDEFLSLGLLKVLNKQSTQTARRHAVDISDSQLLRLLTVLRSLNTRAFAIVYLMSYCGLRYCDLQCLTKMAVLWGDRGILYADVRLSKSIRTDWQRTELVIPPSLGLWVFVDPGWEEVHNEFNLEWDAYGPEETLAPADSSVSELNVLIKRAMSLLSNADEHVFDTARSPTSYSFRRFAFGRFIEASRSAAGRVDWTKASTSSLHFNANTLKAFYYKGARAIQNLQ